MKQRNLDWLTALAAAILVAALALVLFAGAARGQDTTRVQTMQAQLDSAIILISRVQDALSDTGTAHPPVIGDSRLIQGGFPFEGYGAGALQGCAPDSGSWDIQLVPVTEASMRYADDGVPGTLESAIEGPRWREDADLVVLVFTTGGMSVAQNGITFRNQRTDCVFIAGHTAPEPYYNTGAFNVGGGQPGDPWVNDFVLRGLAWVPDRRLDGGRHGANYVGIQCGNNVHVDQLSLSFAFNDMLGAQGFEAGCQDGGVTFARIVCGPTPRGGRCAGFGIDDDFLEVDRCPFSLSWLFGFDGYRRHPMVTCTGPGEITNVLCYNTNDCGRLGEFQQVNVRSVHKVNGPRYQCSTHRAMVYHEGPDSNPLNRGYESEIYFDGVRVDAPEGCAWTSVTRAWPLGDEAHTFFMFSNRRIPVPLDGFGSLVPHPGSDHPTRAVPLDSLALGIYDQVGANWGLACDGTWTRRWTALDAQSVARAAEGDVEADSWERLIDYEDEYGVLEFPEGEPCPDSNGNGVPDAVEARWAGEAGDLGPSGRPNVLEWLEGYPGA